MDEKILEMAETLSSSIVEEGIRTARNNLPERPHDFNGKCVDCDEEIEAPRLRFGMIRCIECAIYLEKHQKLVNLLPSE